MLLEFGIAVTALCLLSMRRESEASERENETMISDQMAQQMNELFIVTNLKNSRDEYVKIADYEKTEMSRLYEVSIPLGLSYTVVAKLHDALETALKRKVKVITQDRTAYIKVYDRELPTKLVDIVPNRPATDDVIIPIGYGWDGVVWWQLNSDYCHAYIGGGVGSGKSSCTHTIITYVTEQYPDIKLLLIDLKRTELGLYEHMDNVEAYVNQRDEIHALAVRIHDEMIARYDKMTDVDKIDDYNSLHPNDRMERWIVMFDEVFDFMLLEDETKDLIATILSKSRACGIHFVFSTQRAVNNVLPTEITTHLSLRVGFRMNSSQESKNLVEDTVLATISKDHKGRGYTNANGDLEEFQGYFMSREKREAIAKKHQRRMSEETKVKRGWFK